MNNDITEAINIFNGDKYTCVLCKESAVYVSTERGVKPLLDWLDNGIDLQGFSAADKVVGKAAAFLYVLHGVKEVYAKVMSEGAICVLNDNGISTKYDIAVKNIINRAGTGDCPMEEAVGELSSPLEALKAIKLKLTQLNS
ncbi:MAG: DUF1893 domain-containing protein, partial [Oscillospiraceae bacterium]|nr:DUF1893 domain-containing protein [Oscillospiraceae bacterium]